MSREWQSHDYTVFASDVEAQQSLNTLIYTYEITSSSLEAPNGNKQQDVNIFAETALSNNIKKVKLPKNNLYFAKN